MPLKTTLEICANSLQSALAAERGGADRIELCSNLEQGGITPSYGLISIVVQKLAIPVHVLIRPRPGNFVYDEDYLNIMRADISACRELGVKGVVFGVLGDGEGEKGGLRVNRGVCAELVELAGDMSCTFHRAFDDLVDQEAGLEDLVELGFERVLTSGGKDKALDGELRLRRLVRRAGDRIIVMPGAGLNVGNIRDVFDRTDAREFHASATKLVDQSGEVFGRSRFAVKVLRTDEGTARGLRRALTEEARERANLHSGKMINGPGAVG